MDLEKVVHFIDAGTGRIKSLNACQLVFTDYFQMHFNLHLINVNVYKINWLLIFR